MQVQAKHIGYYQHKRRREGDKFELVDIDYKVKGAKKTLKAADQFSPEWMIDLNAEDAPAEAPKAPAKANVIGSRGKPATQPAE